MHILCHGCGSECRCIGFSSVLYTYLLLYKANLIGIVYMESCFSRSGLSFRLIYIREWGKSWYRSGWIWQILLCTRKENMDVMLRRAGVYILSHPLQSCRSFQGFLLTGCRHGWGRNKPSCMCGSQASSDTTPAHKGREPHASLCPARRCICTCDGVCVPLLCHAQYIVLPVCACCH